ncbi:hypothetical protein FH966_04425 [Lentibacillus cibarius]|uniref:DUF1189 domain-containing protein n=1 Tax=Lentibacillus cibarius TaxID=2583219 RepID=A0A549YGK4_9BACI|nr:hypothetical protein [Lentibacillus cibarius]TRM11031.1 hypothetical protein FH966_04425 [Lentibacillus cibarius]
MVFLRIFLHSLKLPSKQAVFQLNRIGMDFTVIYMFLLMLLISTPSLVDRLSTASGTDENMNVLFFLIYFFIFFYLPLTIVAFLFIALIAYLGTGLAKLLRRKIRFPILWKLTVYTTTIPFMLYTVTALLFPLNDLWLSLYMLYSLVLIIKVITVYPKRKKRT